MSAPQDAHDPVEAIGHERRDVHITAMTISIIALEVCMFLCCVLGFAFHKGYLAWMKISAAKLSPVAQYVMEAPEPRLQADATDDFKKFHETQMELATTYGWIDTQQGIVRLPIERAKQLVAERGR